MLVEENEKDSRLSGAPRENGESGRLGSRRLAWCDAHTPNRYMQWRKHHLTMANNERQAKRRQNRFTKPSSSSSLATLATPMKTADGGAAANNFTHEMLCTRTSSRRSSLASPDSHKYCSGLIPLRCAEEMSEELEHVLQTHQMMPTRKTLLAVFEHWTQKRKRTNGLPLLKSLHPSVTAASGTFLLNSIRARDVQHVYMRLLAVRNYFAQLRSLTATALAKEEHLRNARMAKLHLYQNLFDPHRSALIHVLRTVATDFDSKQHFLSNATSEHPYDWKIIMENIHNGEYDKDKGEPGGGSFVRDLLLVVAPAAAPLALKETARRISLSIQHLQNGNVDGLKRTRDPMTIVLPVALVRKIKESDAKAVASFPVDSVPAPSSVGEGAIDLPYQPSTRMWSPICEEHADNLVENLSW